MRNLVQKHLILSFMLFSLAVTAFGQKTDREEDMLVGNVKSLVECHYRFTTNDSINHDGFMRRFYQCGLDTERMLSFADSLNPVNEKEFYSKEYDSFGNYTKIGDTRCQYEYDECGRMLKKIVVNSVSHNDTTYFKYDKEGRLVEKKRQNRSEHWTYDPEGRLLERKVFEGEEIREHFTLKYDKKGVLRKSEGYGGIRRDAKYYWEYDSKGNVIFERIENNGIAALTKIRTRYKYDKNDSIIKKTMHETRWYNSPKQKDDFWEETDSLGNVTRYSNYKVAYSEKKEKTKSKWLFTRNEAGGLINEKYVHKNQYGTSVSLGEYDDAGRLIKDVSLFRNDTIPRSIIKYKYDELGRIIEKEIMNYADSQFRKEITRYYKDTDFRTYYATYHGDNEGDYAFSHESLFFFDEHGNCIAHIQWMPGADLYEYYFNVYRYEYYE